MYCVLNILQDVLVCFSLLLSKNILHAFNIAFEVFDYENSRLLEKEELKHVITLLNEVLRSFGDKYLDNAQITDFVDSIFTISGRIDGYICYDDYLDVITEHPIIQLLISIQFQGKFATFTNRLFSLYRNKYYRFISI